MSWVRGGCSVHFHTGHAEVYGNTTLVRSVVKTGQEGVQTMGCLTEVAGFIGILTTIMAKSAVHVESVMFIVHLMKNSRRCHRIVGKHLNFMAFLRS